MYVMTFCDSLWDVIPYTYNLNLTGTASRIKSELSTALNLSMSIMNPGTFSCLFSHQLIQPCRTTCHPPSQHPFCFMLHIFLKDLPVSFTWMPAWLWILCFIYLLPHSLVYPMTNIFLIFKSIISSMNTFLTLSSRTELVPSFSLSPLYHMHIYICVHIFLHSIYNILFCFFLSFPLHFFLLSSFSFFFFLFT